MSQRTALPRFAQPRAGTVFLVLGCQPDRQSLVADLFSGQYRHPLRVVAFETEDGGTRDVTAEVARQVVSCAVESEHELPTAVRAFVKRAGA
jgi:hypothetical protein